MTPRRRNLMRLPSALRQPRLRPRSPTKRLKLERDRSLLRLQETRSLRKILPRTRTLSRMLARAMSRKSLKMPPRLL